MCKECAVQVFKLGKARIILNVTGSNISGKQFKDKSHTLRSSEARPNVTKFGYQVTYKKE